ncbi:MAG TPA: tail fiber domain-containing protein [Candidatus Saccharimonadales bacterium]|nr:tail fiber domain-containing protein [Candidatus Saccharimonadales bacterium]
MKTNRTLTQWLALVALAIFNLQPSTGFAQGTTAFSYQGRLNVNGSPANGLYDVRFMVWDAPTNGNLIAGPLTNSATGVTNGLFAVTLDFGSGVFTGPARWLELDVRTNGSGAFTNLSPCQAITPVPYALYAQTSSGTNGTLTGNSVTLGGGGNSWDIGVANSGNLNICYGDPVTNVWFTPGGDIEALGNIYANGSLLAHSNLLVDGYANFEGSLVLKQGQTGTTPWDISVGNASGPAGYSFNNALIFSVNQLPCLDLFDMSGDNYGAWFPGGLGSAEVDCGEITVRNPGSWEGVVDINSSGELNFAYGGNISSDGQGGLIINGSQLSLGGGIACGGINTGTAGINCATVNATGDIWCETIYESSDSNLKEKFAPIDSRKILKQVANLPISSWNFKNDPATRHLGPMAQDFYAAFNVGTDDKHIATVDEDGVVLAAIQGLNQQLDEQMKAKDAEIQDLKARLEKLEQLIAGKTGGAK